MNVMEMVEHIPGFIRHAQTSPQTICVIFLLDLSVMLEELLKLFSIDRMVFLYCKPYKIGKLNVSLFIIEHVALAGEETTSESYTTTSFTKTS